MHTFADAIYICRVGQNLIYMSIPYIYIYMYMVYVRNFGQGVPTIYTVICSVNVRFWPTLRICGHVYCLNNSICLFFLNAGNVGNLPLVLIASLGSDPGLPFLMGTGKAINVAKCVAWFCT